MNDLPRGAARCAAAFLLVLSGAAFAAGPEIAVGIEKTAVGFVVDATIELPVPLRTAWEVLTDFDNMATIISELASSKITRRSGNTLYVAQEGTAKFGIFSYAFASEREIRLEPMRRILARQLTGTAERYESEIGLAATGGGTQVHYHAEIVPNSGLARIFGGPFIKREVEGQLNAMAAEMARREGL
jgi:carbon monoxide dehydrogenase subunit G